MSMEEEQAYDYDYYFLLLPGTYFCMGLVSYLPAQYPGKGTRPLIWSICWVFYWEFSRPSFSFMPVSPVTLRLNLNRHPQ